MPTLTDKEEEELAYILLGEAGGEGRAGLEAVMHVMVNRSLSGKYPESVYEVATQGGGSQFNAARTVEAARESWGTGRAYQEAVQVVRSVASGTRSDPTGGALHFYANEGPNKIKEPGWFQTTATAGEVQIGNHVFAARRQPAKTSMVRVYEEQRGKVRDKPLDPKLRQLLTQVGERLDVQFSVRSGGQVATRERSLKGVPGGWTGSHRHDHGQSADVQMFRMVNGKRQYYSFETTSGRQLWSEAVRLSANLGATGIGAAVNYMGPQTVHIGYGTAATWGKKDEAAPKWLRTAYTAGANGRSLMAFAPRPATLSGRLAALRQQASLPAQVTGRPLAYQAPVSLVAETKTETLNPLSGLVRPERQAGRPFNPRITMLFERGETGLTSVPQGVAAPVPQRTIVGREPPAETRPTARTAVLPSGKPITLGQTYTVGGVSYVGDVDAAGRGTLRKIDLGILKEAGKPTIVGGAINRALREAVPAETRQAAGAVPGVMDTVAGATGRVAAAVAGVASGPASAITGAVSRIVWVTETVKVRNPNYRVPDPQTMPKGQFSSRGAAGAAKRRLAELGSLGLAGPVDAFTEPEFIEQQVLVQKTVPVTAPKPRVLPSPPRARPVQAQTYAQQRTNTIYTNPTKYGATFAERQAAARKRERLENFGGGEGSGPVGVPQSLVG